MRVLMTADAAGGIWTYADELRDALEASGVDVLLAVLGPDAPPGRADAHLPGALEWRPDPWGDLGPTGEALLDLAAGCDLVHLNSYGFGALEWPCPALVVAHSCVRSWHEAVRGRPAGPEWDRYREWVRAGLLGADEIVAPTRAMLDDLRRLYGLGDRGRVVRNGVSAGPPPERKEPFVLAAGRLWDEAKNLALLDTAAALVDLPVRIAGGGGGRARHAELLGPLPRHELRALMARAEVFAHPARYEPFGLVVAEAAAAGCGLALGDIPSLRELWDGAAAFAAPDDPEALAAAIGRAAPTERRYDLDPRPYLDLYAAHAGVAA
jgi:glycogen synthase